MRVAFSAASLTDLRKIAAESRRSFGAHVAMALERHILTAIERISRFPDSAPRVENRAGVRVVALVRYPYRIFYRADADRLTSCAFVTRRGVLGSESTKALFPLAPQSCSRAYFGGGGGFARR